MGIFTTIRLLTDFYFMKKLSFLVVMIMMAFSCNGQTKSNQANTADEAKSFGKRINKKASITASELASQYNSMAISDTVNVKLTAKVINVCQAKGCWMTLDLGNGDDMMVKFKDYGFFVPTDISGKDVIVNGKAYIAEVSVDEQKHYAEDAGKPKEEVSKITAPKRTYLFEADGVLLK